MVKTAKGTAQPNALEQAAPDEDRMSPMLAASDEAEAAVVAAIEGVARIVESARNST